MFQNDMEAAREAYDAFLSHYPYCYGYWRKYADYEKRKGNKKKCEEVRTTGTAPNAIHYFIMAMVSRNNFAIPTAPRPAYRHAAFIQFTF